MDHIRTGYLIKFTVSGISRVENLGGPFKDSVV